MEVGAPAKCATSQSPDASTTVPQHIAASFGSNFYYQAQAEELAQIRAANMNKTMVTMVVETEHDLHELEITRKEDRDSVIAEYEKGAEENDE